MKGEEGTDLGIRCDFWVYWALYLVLSLLVPVCEENSLCPGLLWCSLRCCCSAPTRPPLPGRDPWCPWELLRFWQPPELGPWLFAVVGAYPSALCLLLCAHLQFSLVHAYLFSWPFNLVPIPDGPSSSEAQQKRRNKLKGQKNFFFPSLPPGVVETHMTLEWEKYPMICKWREIFQAVPSCLTLVTHIISFLCDLFF